VLIAADATYTLDRNPTGVAVYSSEVLNGMAAQHPEADFLFCYRPHRLLRALAAPAKNNVWRWPLLEGGPRPGELFHGMNQRLPRSGWRRQVATFHDLFVMTEEYSTPEFRARFTEQARHAAEQADRIIAVSQFTARQVVELLGVKEEKIRVIPHGVRLPAEAKRERENLVLAVGSIQKRKNTARLVRAFSSACPAGWRLALAGGTGCGADEAMREIEDSPRREDIEVTGHVSAARLAELYAKARIFAFPSLDEGFGIPILEAMANRVPVISSNRSAMPEVCGDAAVMVDPEDEGALGEALRTLAGDEGLRQELAERGWARAREFSWERAIEATWAVYRELI
jgi:glycosyltransferase involved in cell wall biosynthesis